MISFRKRKGVDILKKDVDLLIFGDSITYGIFDSENGGWVNRLRLKLESNKKQKYFVFNLGVPGQSSFDILNRVDFECKTRINKEDDSLIMFAVGIKDSQLINGKNKTNLEDFKKNISNLILKAREYSPNIYFIGLTKVVENHKGYSNEEIIKFDNIIENICKQYQINYVKLYNALSSDDYIDGVHPNSIGHKKISEVIVKQI